MPTGKAVPTNELIWIGDAGRMCQIDWPTTEPNSSV
jgi:hypothetical protein